MGTPSGVAFNPSDPVQQSFLASLALGETGSSGSLYEGVGGSNLSGSQTDQYGFPLWNGTGGSHAAGLFQFEPATWDQIAQEYGLNFSNQSDQEAGAWYLAQQTYANQTGGQSLETALTQGQTTPTILQGVQSALKSIWPSVTGNAAAPQGLAADLSAGIGATSVPSSGATSAAESLASGGAGTAAGTGSSSSSGSSGGILSDVENFFVRFGLIIAGGLIIFISLWVLLSDQGVVPSPKEVGKSVAGGLGDLVAA